MTHAGSVPSDRRACLTLELNVEAEPVAGVVRDASGVDAPFVGWIALTRAIELALEAARVGPQPAPTDGAASS